MAISQFPSKGGIPSGNTASRPGSPVIGDTFYNGETGILEIYNGTTWVACSAPPTAPTIATPTDASSADAYTSTAGKLSVVFTAGSGGGIVSQYNAYTTSGGFTASSSTSTVTLTGLTPGTSYTVYGTAQNNFGTSTNSANATAVTPTTLPQAPTIGTLSDGFTGGKLNLTFTAGNSGGKTISNYKYSLDGTTYTAFSPAQTTSPLSITGLTNGTSYTVRLKAVNANGDSLASSESNSATPSTSVQVEYLVVAGGGGGSSQHGGGGGGGGYRTNFGGTALSLSPSTNYTVTVGGGGAAGPYGSNPVGGDGSKGSNSVFSTITSTGGGFGGAYQNRAGGSGGSGGGGGNDSGAAGTGNEGGFTPVEGYNGGTPTSHSTGGGSGGGGGANGVGVNSTQTTGGGDGGPGKQNNIDGNNYYWAGGGGGGCISRTAAGCKGGNGGIGGGGGAGHGDAAGEAGRRGTGGGSALNAGGDGDYTSSTAATGGAGGENTGGGGGGAGHFSSAPGAGGKGIVILRYPDGFTITIGAGLTGTTASPSGGYKVTKLTNGSGNVSWA